MIIKVIKVIKVNKIKYKLMQGCPNRVEFMGQYLTGKEFNKIYEGHNFVKITNYDEELDIFEKERIFESKKEYNIDESETDSHQTLVTGNIYFIEIYRIPIWVYYEHEIHNIVRYTRKVTIPDDALICIEAYEFKTNKLLLGPKENMNDLVATHIDQVNQMNEHTYRYQLNNMGPRTIKSITKRNTSLPKQSLSNTSFNEIKYEYDKVYEKNVAMKRNMNLNIDDIDLNTNLNTNLNTDKSKSDKNDIKIWFKKFMRK